MTLIHIISRTARIMSRTALGLMAGVLIAGCSTEESLPQVDVESAAPADETRAGTLLAEYAQPRGDRAGGVSVHAQFLDVRGVNYETALEALEVWSPEWQLGVDACSLRTHPLRSGSGKHSDSGAGDSSAAPYPGDLRLELLDVGPITVRGPHDAIRLDARRLPDLLSAFSGVIYGTEQGFSSQPLRIAYKAGAWYTFGAPGRVGNGDFSVSIRAPRPIRIASVGTHLADEGSEFGVDFAQDIALEWQPTGEYASDDIVFLHISSGFGPDRPRLTCRLDDDGSFSVPAALIEQLSEDSAELELTVRRTNAEMVDIDGLEASEFVFSTVDEVTLVDERSSARARE
jgi:hypothetical protein